MFYPSSPAERRSNVPPNKRGVVANGLATPRCGRNTSVSSSHMETPREKPDALPDDISQWVKNIETMRPDIMEGFASHVAKWWSERSLAPLMAAISARRECIAKEVWYRLRKDATANATIPCGQWTPGEVMPDGRIRFRHRADPNWIEIVDADQLESKPADYTIRPRRRWK
jgi:hypothetical protein